MNIRIFNLKMNSNTKYSMDIYNFCTLLKKKYKLKIFEKHKIIIYQF